MADAAQTLWQHVNWQNACIRTLTPALSHPTGEGEVVPAVGLISTASLVCSHQVNESRAQKNFPAAHGFSAGGGRGNPEPGHGHFWAVRRGKNLAARFDRGPAASEIGFHSIG